MSLPDHFVVRQEGWLKTIEATLRRQNDDWMMESEVFVPVFGSVVLAAPRPVDDDHARYVYDTYEVIEENTAPNT